MPEATLYSPRGLTAREVAQYLGCAESTFFAKRATLEASGFPQKNRLTGRWDKKAIDLWLDRISGIEQGMPVDNPREQLQKAIHARKIEICHGTQGPNAK